MNPKKAVLVAPLESFWNHRGMAWGNHQPPKSPSPFGEVLMPDDAWYGSTSQEGECQKQILLTFAACTNMFIIFTVVLPQHDLIQIYFPKFSNSSTLSPNTESKSPGENHSSMHGLWPIHLSIGTSTRRHQNCLERHVPTLFDSDTWHSMTSMTSPPKGHQCRRWPCVLVTAPQPAVLVSGPLLSFRVPVELLGPQPWPCWPCSPSNVSTCLNMSQQRISRWEGSIW